MADVIDPPGAGPAIDLTNCEREPIHIPGSVQPHAVMLVLGEPTLVIRQASANAGHLLGLAQEDVVGSPLSRFMWAPDLEHLQKCLAEKAIDSAPYYLPPLQLGPSGAPLEASIHRSKGALILELENWPDRPGVADRELLSSVKGMLTFSASRETVAGFCQQTAEDIRKFTGFDRVMVYRFEPDLSGHVLAEAKRDDLESYLELHYPASDIPKQARELLRLSKLRLIPDVNYAPVPLLPVLRADTRQPLDMSFCVTRSMSPIHVEYLQNMGVRASMSISIVIENQLWGLFACHHYSPRYVSHAARSACDFLAHALAILVAGREQAEEFRYTERLNENQRLLSHALADKTDFGRAVREMDGSSIGGIEAEGAALVMNGVVCLKGRTPGEQAVLELANYFWTNVPDEVWHTDRFKETLPAAARFAPEVCGILGARLAREQRGYLFWFRVEVAQTVKWAGDLAQNKMALQPGDRLSPRKSFALWQQQVVGRSRFWLRNEITAARMMRHSFHELYATQTQTLVVLNAELTQKLDRADQALQSKDQFLATLSHELRTPLNPALLLASEEAENAALSTDVRGNFAAIRDNIELEARLIDDLLDLSRIAHGKVALERKPLGLHAALRQALAILNSDFASKPVRLVLRLCETEAIVHADIVRLLQVFWNVLKNAIKFTPKDGAVTVESRVDVERSLAIVSISDTGVGLSAAELPRIFDAFSQGDHALQGGSRKFGGLGLGLAITRSLLNAHGGRIIVESGGLNQGSTFTIELPLAPQEKNLPAHPAARSTKSTAPFPGTSSLDHKAPAEILLVEDHAATRMAMALILQRRGYAIAQAATIKSALLLAADRDFALVISDIGLPDGEGYTLMRELKKIRSSTRAIALSGRGMDEDRAQALAAGFADLMVKPINIQDLELVVLKVLNAPPA